MTVQVSLECGSVLLPCVCGLDAVDGWHQRDGASRVFFVHCPDCDRWATAATERKAVAEWAWQVNHLRTRLGLVGVWA